MKQTIVLDGHHIKVKCPYCGMDFGAMDRHDNLEIECSSCNRTYEVKRHMHYTYEITKLEDSNNQTQFCENDVAFVFCPSVENE